MTEEEEKDLIDRIEEKLQMKALEERLDLVKKIIAKDKA